MRLAVVIPGDDLGERDLGAIFDKKFPALCEEPVVAAVNEVLVVCLRAVMLEKRVDVSGRSLCANDWCGTYSEEPRRDAGHVCTVLQVVEVYGIGFEVGTVVPHGPTRVPLTG